MESMKAKVFFIPVLIAFGSYALYYKFNLVFLSAVGLTAALACAVWIFWFSWLLYKVERRRNVTDFLREYMKLDDSEKAELGINTALERVKIETTRRDAQGVYQGETREQLPQGITPARFYMFLNGIATMYLEGGEGDQGFDHQGGIHAVNFSYDVWGRPGKLFSQPVYKSLLEWLDGKRYIEKIGRDFWITDQGVEFFLEKAGKVRPETPAEFQKRDMLENGEFEEWARKDSI